MIDCHARGRSGPVGSQERRRRSVGAALPWVVSSAGRGVCLLGIADEVRARRHGVALSAQRQFTNRLTEKASFADKVAELREWRNAHPEWAHDLSSPRANVLTFYGHGGIGKTSLSCELERDFVDESDHQGLRRIAVRADFSEPSARDAELYLLSLRAGLADLAGVFPAFDSALGIYWARQHPGVPMSDFVRRQTALGGLVDRGALADNLKSFLEEILDGGGLLVGGARRIVGLTWEKVREVQLVRQLTRDCPFYEGCMTETDLDELRLHLPLLLAWDLMRLKKGSDSDVVVFLDTFEHVGNARRVARPGDLEDAICRSIYFLSGVLFVVTTRSRLDWASDRRAPTLDFCGAGTWPGLDVSGGDQHHVGVLSSEDSEHFLGVGLVDESGRPAIPDSLRREIAGLSGGVPLYLDVAVDHFLRVLTTGRQPDRSDFSSGIPDIVLRLMENLDRDECDLLRVASLLGVFDRASLRAALPDLRPSTIENFLAMSLVIDRGTGLFSVHELLQVSIRSQDSASPSAWSADEWHEVEQRLVAFWSEKLGDDSTAVWSDRRTLALAFWQMVGLISTTDVESDVLADMMMKVQLSGEWATIDAAREQPPELLTDRGRATMLVLDGMMARQIGGLDQADELLSRALASPALTGDLARLAKYYLAETRDIHVGDPMPLLAALTAIDDRIGSEARLAHAHALLRQGDLIGALDIGVAFPAGDDPEFSYRLHELLGHVLLFAGQFEQAADHFEVTREVAALEGSALLGALGLRHLCLTLCWNQPAAALALLDEAESLNRDLGLHPGIGQCLTARAVAYAGNRPSDDVDALLDEAHTVFVSAGYVDDALAPVAAGVFTAAVGGDLELARARRHELEVQSAGRRTRTWRAAAAAWVGERDHFDAITWPQGSEAAWTSWAGLIAARHDRLDPLREAQTEPPGR